MLNDDLIVPVTPTETLKMPRRSEVFRFPGRSPIRRTTSRSGDPLSRLELRHSHRRLKGTLDATDLGHALLVWRAQAAGLGAWTSGDHGSVPACAAAQTFAGSGPTLSEVDRMEQPRVRHHGDGLAAGFGAVSREERQEAERFFATLLGPPRPLWRMSRRPRDQALLGTPLPTEHQTTDVPVLQAGNVGPALNGRQNAAHIALVSPSGALDPPNDLAQINALTGSFTTRFNSVGHQVTFDLAPGEPSSPHVAGAFRLAGTDAQRWASLRWGLFDPATSAAIAIRGGHGATRLLDELAAHVNAQQARRWPLIPPLRVLFPPKRIAGFSDFTAVLLAVYSLLGWASIHGPMLAAPGNAASQTSLIAALTRAPADLHPNNRVDARLTLVGPAPANAIRGVLLGGNLSLVDALYGSPFFPSLQGALLFVEEDNEQGRKIDRMIEGLKHRGAAGQVRAVVVGRTTNIDSNAVATLFHESWRVPCVSGLASGHGNPNRALWVGLEYELQFLQAGRASLFLRP